MTQRVKMCDNLLCGVSKLGPCVYVMHHVVKCVLCSLGQWLLSVKEMKSEMHEPKLLGVWGGDV